MRGTVRIPGLLYTVTQWLHLVSFCCCTTCYLSIKLFGYCCQCTVKPLCILCKMTKLTQRNNCNFFSAFEFTDGYITLMVSNQLAPNPRGNTMALAYKHQFRNPGTTTVPTFYCTYFLIVVRRRAWIFLKKPFNVIPKALSGTNNLINPF